MKLVVEIQEYQGKVGVLSYFKADDEFDVVHNPLNQAEEVARLGEVAQEIERMAKAYYSKDKALMPKVLKKSDKDPSTE